MKFSAVNIQYPISSLILAGTKTIETRTYPLPVEYIGKELLLIETPGNLGIFEARIVGKIIFGPSFKYTSSEQFYSEHDKHFVDEKSPWKWNEEKGKWGWPVLSCIRLENEVPAPKKKGIKFTREIEL